MMDDAVQQLLRLNQISQFLYKQARLQDEHRFADWEALWTDDAVYWVPANGEGGDPEQEMSITYDNRSRIGLRIKQFFTGKRFSQNHRLRLRRVIANIELLGDEPGGTRMAASMMLFESSWRMAYKKVGLVNNSTPLLTMAFLM